MQKKSHVNFRRKKFLTQLKLFFLLLYVEMILNVNDPNLKEKNKELLKIFKNQ